MMGMKYKKKERERERERKKRLFLFKKVTFPLYPKYGLATKKKTTSITLLSPRLFEVILISDAEYIYI